MAAELGKRDGVHVLQADLTDYDSLKVGGTSRFLVGGFVNNNYCIGLG